MPELEVAGKRWTVAPASNLLDALNAGGCKVPYSCRAGSCHACLVRCLSGEPADAKPEALDRLQRAEGWRLSCQCLVVQDLVVEVFDPARDGIEAQVASLDWPAPDVLRLRLAPSRPLRYSAGQHLLLWNDEGIARPYSLASLPGVEDWLEFHLDCRSPGLFSDRARRLAPGDRLRLGELHGGALHYDPAWDTRPLLFLASGTGLAPLWGLLREALRHHHQGPIRVIHLAHGPSGHYLAEPLAELTAAHPGLALQLITPAELPEVLAQFRLVSRQTIALLCGDPASVEDFARRLYLAGLPRNQLLADTFLTREV
ncbi:iron-sulfur-binding ferredoxin reductase [Pseudomonas sp. BN102]|uniref:iron-sulfur-binding ferredoxin reductase n=1 Tax=Pseudomonas sp. BN102 TaxID=2567886 RepID=UPI0024538AB4|nr:iron-sulfur-binding ferredoxin reductase [Pseudomonas sp. BN102]MDH4609521.1 iron-sulfur-binding ferredoxin reductase [Pseudomonas sp. BN102]